jgi:mRNA interferase RelE/StbE
VNVQFRASFTRDLCKIKNKNVILEVKETIEALESASYIKDFPVLEKLKTSDGYYRIKIGDYRIGLAINANTIYLIRCLNRKDIYRYFP